MFERNAFLRAYNIDEADFKAANVPWEELAAIYDDYLSIEGKLRGIGKEFVNDYLYDIERAGIHSYRYRTKSPGHPRQNPGYDPLHSSQDHFQTPL